MNTPDSDYSPPGAPSKQPPGEDRGSLLTGFLLGWAVLIGSCTVLGTVWAVLSAMLSNQADWVPVLAGLTALLPIVATIALLIWFAAKGKTRTAAGVGLTFASLFAVVLLLVAACFGLLANTNFH
jgi:hypothetical protein